MTSGGASPPDHRGTSSIEQNARRCTDGLRATSISLPTALRGLALFLNDGYSNHPVTLLLKRQKGYTCLCREFEERSSSSAPEGELLQRQLVERKLQFAALSCGA